MKIAVVGCEISGLVAARLLSSNHNVTLFESSNYPGGHANTVECKAFGKTFVVDTGFMVFNTNTYPIFCQLLKQLDVRTQESDMSFSVSAHKPDLNTREVHSMACLHNGLTC
jgi:predicted NAD/FAD-binding protein